MVVKLSIRRQCVVICADVKVELGGMRRALRVRDQGSCKGRTYGKLPD
jgi:hypothetical protein